MQGKELSLTELTTHSTNQCMDHREINLLFPRFPPFDIHVLAKERMTTNFSFNQGPKHSYAVSLHQFLTFPILTRTVAKLDVCLLHYFLVF